MLDFLTPTALITCAAVTSGLGYLVINQMSLRIMMLIGSSFYIAYYATASDDPLWGAIYTSSALMGTNLIGMGSLVSRRFRFTLPAAYTDLYERFDLLIPGDFRLVMKHAQRLTLSEDCIVTREGAPVEHLIFVNTGAMRINKNGANFPLPAGIFVGEVAYLLDRNSAATTTLHAGCEIIRWDLAALRHACARNPRLKLAVDAMLSHDLAQKVAQAVAHPASRAVPA